MIEIDAELREADRRLANWGEWARVRKPVRSAMSAEGRYRRPAAEDDARRQPALSVDPFDAARVDAALSPASGFPRRFAQLLVAHYVSRADYRTTCRRLSIHWQAYPSELRKAVVGARNRLTRREEVEQ